MALLWREQSDGVLYEVRRHGRTLRLFANGIQHSEFHPDRLVTGSVWDLLWLPVLFDDPRRYRRILVLGLGGGTLIAPLLNLCSPELIVAVDRDARHIHVAKEFFAVADACVSCHCADAVEFVRHWDGEPFDLVIEDLFAASDRTVSRAVPASGRWFGQLARLVNRDGMLVMNFGDWAEYRDSWVSGERALRGWGGRFRFATPDCHNAVLAFRRHNGDSSQLRLRLKAHDQLAPELQRGRLDYTVRDLSRL